MRELIEQTVAYRIFCGDKKNNSLSHAYLVVCEDEYALPAYMKIFAKTLACEQSEEFCGECRNCKLIEKNVHTDVTFYPKADKEKILSGDVDELISMTYLKPFEADKRIFVICGAENMNGAAQNKILKTLEEPPKNVFVLMGTSNESALLSTVKSRVKKLTVPPFSTEGIIKGLKNICPDEKKLKAAATYADGKAGLALAYYNGERELNDLTDFACDVFLKMTSSSEVLNYSLKIDKTNVKEFFIAVKKVLNEAVRGEGDDRIKAIGSSYPVGAAIKIIEKVNEFERALNFNVGVSALTDKLLLSVLEEKYRWKKL